MEIIDQAPLYQIWGPDETPYGPVELPTLVKWVKEERVVAETWIYLHEEKSWLKAAQVPELKMFFQRRQQGCVELTSGELDLDRKLKPSSLRRIRIFAGMDDDQLAAFLSFMEVCPFGAAVHVVRRGDSGDAMYLVLDGEVRSCLMTNGTETPIATLTPGSLFGEISLLDSGPHAADVITNQESTLLRISENAFQKMTKEAPQLALPFLLSLSKAIAGRVRVLTKRYEDSAQISRTGAEVLAAVS